METIRLTKGGISNDVELSWVEPHEVAHLEDFTEEILRCDTPSTPGSPFSVNSPYSVSEFESSMSDAGPPLKKQKINHDSSQDASPVPTKTPPTKKKKAETTPKKARTPKKKATPKATPKATKQTKKDTKITLKLPVSTENLSEDSSKDSSAMDISTSETNSAPNPRILEIQAEIKDLESQIKKLEEQNEVAVRNQNTTTNETIKQRYQTLIGKNDLAIQVLQNKISIKKQEMA